MFTKNGKDTSIRYDQTKRIIETFLKDLKNTKQCDFYLESCNVCAAATCCEAVGAKFKYELPKVDGKSIISQADFLFDVIYKHPDTPVKSDTLCENEIPANLAFGIEKISNAKAEYKEFKSVSEMTTALKNALNKGHAVELSYLTDYGGGHFIALVGIEGNKIYAYDSWASNKHCKNNGALEEYDISFFEQRCKERLRFIEIYL